MAWKPFISPEADQAVRAIIDKKIRREIRNVLKDLSDDPGIGKILIQELDGLRSVKAWNAKFRIVYKIDRSDHTIHVIYIGERKPGKADDVYAIARRLVKTFLN